MKCLYCNEELVIPKEEVRNGTQCCVCRNPKCEFDGWHFPVKVIAELTKTKQALDKAIWWLNEIVESHRCTPISTAEMALKEITALEQKDKQCGGN